MTNSGSWDIVRDAILKAAQRHSGPPAECVVCRYATPQQRAKRHDPSVQEYAAILRKQDKEDE